MSPAKRVLPEVALFIAHRSGDMVWPSHIPEYKQPRAASISRVPFSHTSFLIGYVPIHVPAFSFS